MPAKETLNTAPMRLFTESITSCICCRRVLRCLPPSEEPTFYHQTNKFRIEKTVDTWADVSPSSVSSPNQYHYIPIGLDSYSMVDLVSISFVKSLGLSPCTRPKHQHVEPVLEGVGQTQPKTYGFFHLRLHITDHWNHSLVFIHPFLAVDCNTCDSQILLGRPLLKDFKINLLNDIDSWEFDQKPKVTKISACQFAQEISSTTCIFKVPTIFRPCDDNTDPWEDEMISLLTLAMYLNGSARNFV